MDKQKKKETTSRGCTIFLTQRPDMLGQSFTHFEHINGLHTKKGLQRLVTVYFSLVLWILQIVFFNICPNFLHNLKQRKQKQKFILSYPLISRMHKFHYTSKKLSTFTKIYTERFTSVLANFDAPTTSWSCGERLLNLLKPPLLFLAALSTLFDLIDKLKVTKLCNNKYNESNSNNSTY